jgi:hypothetical protein
MFVGSEDSFHDSRILEVVSPSLTVDGIEFIEGKGISHVVIVGEIEHFPCLLAGTLELRCREWAIAIGITVEDEW